jgi:hemolysin III
MAPTEGEGTSDRPVTTTATRDAVEPDGHPGRHRDEALKPTLRGWIHAGMAPVAAVAGLVLVILSETPAARWSTAVFALATTVLFTASAVYHRGTWSPRTTATLRRLDHANIFLVIAGTYTPLAVLLLPTTTATWLLAIIWTGALAGIATRVLWLGAPRWFYVPLYVILGLVSVAYLPQFSAGGQALIVWLVAVGGVAYILGAVVYGTKRPNPSPNHLGFHEVFHILTVIGYACHYVAVSIAAYGSA